MNFFKLNSTIRVLSEQNILFVSGGNQTEETSNEDNKSPGYFKKINIYYTSEKKYSFPKPVY